MDSIIISSSELLLPPVADVAPIGCSEELLSEQDCCCSFSSVFEILCSINDSLELAEFNAFKMS